MVEKRSTAQPRTAVADERPGVLDPVVKRREEEQREEDHRSRNELRRGRTRKSRQERERHDGKEPCQETRTAEQRNAERVLTEVEVDQRSEDVVAGGEDD